MAFLILYWRQLHSTAVSAFRFIKHFDVIENITPGFVTCRVGLSSNPFPLQKLKKSWLRHCHGSFPPTHAAEHIVGLQKALLKRTPSGRMAQAEEEF